MHPLLTLASRAGLSVLSYVRACSTCIARSLARTHTFTHALSCARTHTHARSFLLLEFCPRTALGHARARTDIHTKTSRGSRRSAAHRRLGASLLPPSLPPLLLLLLLLLLSYSRVWVSGGLGLRC